MFVADILLLQRGHELMLLIDSFPFTPPAAKFLYHTSRTGNAGEKERLRLKTVSDAVQIQNEHLNESNQLSVLLSERDPAQAFLCENGNQAFSWSYHGV